MSTQKLVPGETLPFCGPERPGVSSGPMKISELSERSGVPLPTIKFYIREGLLPPGEPTAKNQAAYGQAHVDRLDLVCALKEEAGMSVATIARVLASADGAREDAIAGGLRALDDRDPVPLDETRAEYQAGRKLVERAAKSVGWTVRTDDAAVSDALREASRAMMTIRRAFPWIETHHVAFYARVADEIAAFEIPDDWDPAGAPGASLKYALLGTYLFEPLILALRRFAHAERSRVLADTRAREPRKNEGKKSAGHISKVPSPARKPRAASRRR
jgi:DNA-binding transcriptional MerR regulator